MIEIIKDAYIFYGFKFNLFYKYVKIYLCLIAIILKLCISFNYIYWKEYDKIDYNKYNITKLYKLCNTNF